MSRVLTDLPGRYHQAFNDRDFDAWREVFDENVELVIDGTVFRGVDAAVGYGVGSVTQFPGLYIESERIVAASGDTIVTEVGLANGDPDGGPSRRQGAVCEICRVRDGRIVSVRSYYMAEAPEPDTVRVPIRGEAARIAEEQTALRRVATLLAQGVSQDELFAAVSQEIGWLVGADPTSLMRFEPDDTVTLVAAWSAEAGELPIGTSYPLDDALRAIRDSGQGWRWGPAELPPSGPFVEEARQLGIRAAVGVPIVVEAQVWGVAFASSSSERPFADDAEERIAGFAELIATAIANAQAREKLRVLVDEQAALRRVATLVARERPPEVVFAAVAEEVGRLLAVEDTRILRYESDGFATVMASWGKLAGEIPVGSRWRMGGDNVSSMVLRSGRSARMDLYGDASGSIGSEVRQLGIQSAVGTPITVRGRIWGAMLAGSLTPGRLPAGTEERIGEFTALVGTAISKIEARADADRLAAEQAALRRVATLVARESSPDQVFAAVTEEVGRLLGLEDTRMLRFEGDGSATVVASWGRLVSAFPVGMRISLDGVSATGLVSRTGRSARIEDFANPVGEFAATLRRCGVHSAVAAPIVVDEQLWGAMTTAALTPEPIPVDTEARMQAFSELVATAIANTEARADLAASRARIVAAADEERRRVVRDLHDGAQQRLVHTIVTLRLADRALEADPASARQALADALEQAQQATHELRELSHGIMPAVLTQGGLRKAVEALASRFPVPVRIDIPVGRMPARIEATAYFVVAEALTNVSKHAHAGRAEVSAQIRGQMLHVAVSDDGIGGAQATGTGLVGLRDRLAVLNGRLQIESPPGGGTLVTAAIPLP